MNKITFEELKKKVELSEEKPKSINILKRKSKFSMGFWKDYFKERYFPDKTIIVNFELLNGMFKTFLVKEKEGGFKYKKGIYIFDNESKYYNIDGKSYMYDYHENYCLPIKRKIPIVEMKKVLESAEISDVEYSSNPKSLKQFIVSKVAEQILASAQISEFMRQLRLMIIIILTGVIVHLFLFMHVSGMLENLHLPF